MSSFGLPPFGLISNAIHCIARGRCPCDDEVGVAWVSCPFECASRGDLAWRRSHGQRGNCNPQGATRWQIATCHPYPLNRHIRRARCSPLAALAAPAAVGVGVMAGADVAHPDEVFRDDVVHLVLVLG